MAELVQSHMESMTEEINEMKRTKLFTEEELSLILKARKDHEYKINSVSKELEDFKNYIMYEKVLLKQIQNRRNKNRTAEKKSGIEYKILKRIKKLYETALQRYSNDFSLCLQYFKFCKQSNFINAATTSVQNMIRNCSQKPEAWIVAANWYAYDKKDLNTAILVINEGLTIHKDSQLLYTEAIKLELLCINPENQDADQEKIVCEKIKTYMKFISENTNDYQYFIDSLALLEKYPFTGSAQNFIIDHLLEKYSERELVWDVLAERERKGLHYSENSEGKTNATLCIDKYKEGLQKVCADEKAILWSKYLDCVTSAQHLSELPTNDKNAFLKSAFEQASNENYLSENLYIKWLELVSDTEGLNVLKRGTVAFPESLDLWKLRLQYETLNENDEEVDTVFKLGFKQLKEKSLPLWLIYLRYYTLLVDNDMVEHIYKEGMKQSEEIAQPLKPKYIRWVALTKGMDAARVVYNALAHQRPYCKELHLAMIKLETIELETNYTAWANTHEFACQQFGKEDVDVWLDYVRFYLYFCKDDGVNINEKIQQICRKAENTLSPLLQNNFKDKYMQVLQEQ